MAEYVCELTDKLATDLRARRREEVVRCRECAFSDYGGRRCNNFLDVFDDAPALVMPDSFCSWGERRSE